MINRLSALFELQQIDDELDLLEELRGDLPLAVNELNSEIQIIKETIASKENDKKDAFDTIKSNEEEIELLSANLKKFKDQLFQVRNNKEYDALNKEIEHSEQKIETLKKENKDLENKIQQLKIDIEEVDPRLKELEAEVNEKEKELQEIIKENEKEEIKLQKKREDIASKIKKADLNTYMRIRKACGGKAVATVSRGACTGCHNVVPPQRQLEIRANKRLFTCESCGRLLISSAVVDEISTES